MDVLTLLVSDLMKCGGDGASQLSISDCVGQCEFSSSQWTLLTHPLHPLLELHLTQPPLHSFHNVGAHSTGRAVYPL